MSYTITHACIACDRCLNACPTGAIQRQELKYWVNAEACNNCEGRYGVPQCWAACPTHDGCVPFLSGVMAINSQLSNKLEPSSDYWENWFATYNGLVARLKQTKQTAVWQQWFDAYSQQLSKVLPLHHSPLTEVQP